MPSVATTTPTTTAATKKQLWQVDCTPECGFMVRDHDQKALIQEANMHCKIVHDKTYSEKETFGMAKKV